MSYGSKYNDFMPDSVTNATNATNVGITNDTATNATMFPVWVTANTGNLPAKVTSTKLSFNPSTGLLTTTGLSATTVNSMTITANAATLTVATGKTLTCNNNITLSGTDGKALVLTTGLTVTTNDGTIAFGAASKTLTVPDNTTVPIVTQAITFSGPSAPRTYTLPDSAATILTTAGATLNSIGGLSPTGTTSTASFVMMGVGSTFAITPVKSTRIHVNVYGDGANSLALDGCVGQISFGTGAAPANGAAASGTVISGAAFLNVPTSVSATVGSFFALSAVITGLTPGTAIWIDIQLKATTAGTASISNVSCNAFEM